MVRIWYIHSADIKSRTKCRDMDIILHSHVYRNITVSRKILHYQWLTYGTSERITYKLPVEKHMKRYNEWRHLREKHVISEKRAISCSMNNTSTSNNPDLAVHIIKTRPLKPNSTELFTCRRFTQFIFMQLINSPYQPSAIQVIRFTQPKSPSRNHRT